ncbi:Sym1p [Rhizophagus irregularis DAOM 197198w]|uniref:Sym1p n=1 Tax=Rhizophagus irregularis (strain DAOM 197198w) TaxID=1432141 RepID=A0A015KYI5_RHIIW|nr:Sym1p [Rhizophagus irregularis DAOM 197198w]
MSFFSWYKNHLFRRPILIQTITTGTLFAAGDIIAQQIVEQRGLKSHNFYRTLRLGGFGLCIAGPSTAIWYRTLDRVITIKNPMLGLLTRVTLDQAIFAPCFITTFFVGQALLEGQENSQILEKLGDVNIKSSQNIYLKDIVLLKTLVVNCVALGWNTYLSVINKKSSDKVSVK